MKFIFIVALVLLISYPALAQFQTLVISSATKKFPADNTCTFELSANQIFESALLVGSYTLRIDEVELKNVTVNGRVWTIGLPNANEIVGQNKKITFRNASGAFAEVSLEGIYADVPQLKGLETLEINTDLSGPQDFTMIVNRVAYISKIEVIGTGGDVNFAVTNLSELDRANFLVDDVKNKISFQIKLMKSSVTAVKLKVFYLDQNFALQSVLFNLPQVRFKKKYEDYKTFPIELVNDKHLYTDDFSGGNIKVITFDFTNVANVADGVYTIQNVPELSLLCNGTPTITVPAAAGGTRKFDVQVKAKGQQLPARTYLILLKPVSGSEIACELKINSSPACQGIRLGTGDIKSSITLVKTPTGRHTLTVVGETTGTLHDIPDLNVALVHGNGSILPLKRTQRLSANEVICEIDFGAQQIPVGQYKVLLLRENRPEYSTTNGSVSIIYPKDIDSDQTANFELYKPIYPDTIKRFLYMRDRIITDASPLIVQLSREKNIDLFGPQYLEVTASYIKNNGNEVKATMRDGRKAYIQIGDTIKYWDLKDEFGIERLKPNEKIRVTVKHSAEVYGSTKTSIPETRYYYNYMKLSDRLGITFSLPPYLVATRKVKRKTVDVNDEGETVVTYDGKAEQEFQHLLLNAGLGIKLRFKDKDYEDSRFGIGLYFLGMDFTNSQSRTEQRNDPNNYDFIERGSFNLLALLEYSVLNLDNTNVRVPVYFGAISVLDPVDDGSSIALAFGLGVDIRLAGKN